MIPAIFDRRFWLPRGMEVAPRLQDAGKEPGTSGIDNKVTRYAPFRFFVLWTMVLIVAAAVASSSARAFALGEATVLSALGEPLRVVIPVTAARGETIAPDCFGLASSGDGPGASVTAKVSLERAASGPRLAVTTSQGVGEPVLRLSLRAGCEAQTRHDYVLLLDPPTAAERSIAAAAEASAPVAREPGQERLAAATSTSAAARRDLPERSGTGARNAQRPVGAGYAPAMLRYASLDPSQSNGSFQHVAATTESVRVAPAPRVASIPIDRSKDLWWTIAVAIGGLGIIVLGAILVRQGRPAPRNNPAWSSASMRIRNHTRARSITNLAAAPVTLAHSGMPTDALLTRAAPTTRSWVAPATAVTLPNLATTSKTPAAATRARATLSAVSGAPDALDTLLNEIDADLSVEHAVRRVHATAIGQVERDIGSDAILKAIEAAERDLMLAPLAPADNALGHALDTELLGSKPPLPKKAAA
jgi:hypothetical protein